MIVTVSYSSMDKKTRAREALRRLRRAYREPGEFVRGANPLELVIGTVLSAQCTDKKVNEVTKKLFKKYRTARAAASPRTRDILYGVLPVKGALSEGHRRDPRTRPQRQGAGESGRTFEVAGRFIQNR